MSDDEFRELARQAGVTLYTRFNGERCWHDMKEGSLLAAFRAVERAAIERAAGVCEHVKNRVKYFAQDADACAAAIRALIDDRAAKRGEG